MKDLVPVFIGIFLYWLMANGSLDLGLIELWYLFIGAAIVFLVWSQMGSIDIKSLLSIFSSEKRDEEKRDEEVQEETPKILEEKEEVTSLLEQVEEKQDKRTFFGLFPVLDDSTNIHLGGRHADIVRHAGIGLFCLCMSVFTFDSFVTESDNIDLYISSVIFIMFLSWALNLAPQIKVIFLFWTLVFGSVTTFYIHQEMLNYETQWSSYQYAVGDGYEKNISVRNYSINRRRLIEERRENKRQLREYEKERQRQERLNPSRSESGYSGGSSHYGGGLSGGK